MQEGLGELGAYGCTLSGAGPSTLLWVDAGEADDIARRVASRIESLELDGRVMALASEPYGVVVNSESA